MRNEMDVRLDIWRRTQLEVQRIYMFKEDTARSYDDRAERGILKRTQTKSNVQVP